MTTFSGGYSGSIGYVTLSGVSENLQADDGLQSFDTVDLSQESIDGGNVDGQPIVELVQLLNGDYGYAGSGNDFFYNRIYIVQKTGVDTYEITSSLDVGNVVSDINKEFFLWNAFFEAKDFTDFDISATDGFTVTGQTATPYVIAPLQVLDYDIDITKLGPYLINDTIRWTIDSEVYEMVVTGRRLIVFPIRPDWSSPVQEGLGWLTDIIRSFSGREQRRSIRTKPRRSFAYNATLMGEEPSILETMLWGWQNKPFAVPIWTDKVSLTVDATIGQNVLQTSATANLSFIAGGVLIIYRDADNYESVGITAVNSNSINLNTNIKFNWSAGTKVFPAVIGRLPTSVPVQRLTNGVLVANIAVDCDPVLTDPNMVTAAAPTTYNGYEVLTRKPNWVAPLNHEMQYMFDTMDNQSGATHLSTSEDVPRIVKTYRFLLNGRSDIAWFRSFFKRCRGAAVPFYVPSWHLDFTLVATTTSADPSLVVKGQSFMNIVGLSPYRDRLCIRLNDGQVFYRQIIDIDADGANTKLSLNAAFGVDVDPEDVVGIHFLNLSRFASDDLTLSWHTDGVAAVETNFITVPA